MAKSIVLDNGSTIFRAYMRMSLCVKTFTDACSPSDSYQYVNLFLWSVHGGLS